MLFGKCRNCENAERLKRAETTKLIQANLRIQTLTDELQEAREELERERDKLDYLLTAFDQLGRHCSRLSRLSPLAYRAVRDGG